MQIESVDIRPRNSKRLLVTLVISDVVYVVSLFFWLMIAMFSPMLFDDPAAVDSWQPWLLFGGVMVYPLLVLVSAILSWVFFAKRKGKAAMIWNYVPCLWLVPVLIFFINANLSS